MSITTDNLGSTVEADHGALKQVIRPARGFQAMQTADATIKGFKVMRMIRRRRGPVHQQIIRTDRMIARWAEARRVQQADCG